LAPVATWQQSFLLPINRSARSIWIPPQAKLSNKQWHKPFHFAQKAESFSKLNKQRAK
jgi:hypothetical protein